nr:sugar phosphate isomerase/epimerase [Desulfuromonadales bacterium]
MAPYLLHMHLHDNHGDRDAHLPVGKGTFDFQRLFSLLRAHRLTPSATFENPSIDDALASRQALASIL